MNELARHLLRKADRRDVKLKRWLYARACVVNAE